MSNSILTSGSSRRLDHIFLLIARYKAHEKYAFCPPMILRRGQNFSPNKRKLSTAGSEITPLVELISKPNKMNFKSSSFLVHPHNLYIVKIFVRFRLFFWHCNPSDHFASLHNVLVGITCERQTFLLALNGDKRGETSAFRRLCWA